MSPFPLYPFSHACQFTHFTVLFLLSPIFFLYFFLFISLASPSFVSPTHIFTPPPFSLFMYLHLPHNNKQRKQQQSSALRTMHKQPPECCRLLGYPAAIIASHYSWDLPFNPGHVIGLLSSIQAGLTPQTGIHSAAMQCYQQMQQTNRDRNTRPRRSRFTRRASWVTMKQHKLCSSSSLSTAAVGHSVLYDTEKVKLHAVESHVLVWVSWVGTERTQHKHSQDFKVALLHRTKQTIPVGRCVTHMWTDNHTHTHEMTVSVEMWWWDIYIL